MKRFISIAAILAASAAVALAQPPSASAKKPTQTVRVVAKTTTTYDTITIAPTHATAINDSLLNARFDRLTEKIDKIEKQNKEIDTRVRKIANEGNLSRGGNFVLKMLQNTIPMLPFVAGVLIAIFWFRYSYKKRMMRQEMIYKYIDRGEQVPEWLARAEAPAEASAATPNGAQSTSRANAKLFLVLSIILASVALIFMIALTNASRWLEMFSALTVCGAFGFAAVFCFRQYLKRTE